MKWLGQHMFEFDAHFLQTVYIGHEASGSAFVEVPNRLDGSGGSLFITAGGAGGTNQTGGDFFISAGGPTGNALGGNIYFNTWTNNGSSGDTFDANPVANNQDYRWTFGNTGYTAIPGDLRLPDDGVIETTGSLKFRLDYDQPGTDETDNSFSFLNYTTEIANLDDEGNLQIDGNLTPAGIILDGNTITGVDDSGEFTDDDAHIMTSAAVADYVSGHGIWHAMIHGYATSVTSTTNYYHRLSTTYLNWTSGTTTNPTSFDSAYGMTPFFIAHTAGKITKINVQGESNTTDTFKFYFYKASASNDEANMTLTLMGSTAAITPATANKSYSYQGTVDFSFTTNQRLYAFYKKDNNDAGSTSNYFAISVSGEYT
jgi:hypothetical protein